MDEAPRQTSLALRSLAKPVVRQLVGGLSCAELGTVAQARTSLRRGGTGPAELGIALDATEISTLMLPIVTYIATSGWKAASLAKAAIEAGAAAAQPTTGTAVAPING